LYSTVTLRVSEVVLPSSLEAVTVSDQRPVVSSYGVLNVPSSATATLTCAGVGGSMTVMPRRSAVRRIRRAISPRFAMKSRRMARRAAPVAAYAPPTVPTAVIAPPPTLAEAALTAKAAAAAHAGAVLSPMVGTAYRKPSPEAKDFVEVGSKVQAGEKVLLVEAMKTFNEIVAPRAGTVTAIYVEDGTPVEYGEPLLVIE